MTTEPKETKQTPEAIQATEPADERSSPLPMVQTPEGVVPGYKKQVPGLGRIVHYFAYGTPGGEFPSGVPRAAIITDVKEPGNPESVCSLCIINPSGLFFSLEVPFGIEPGSWNWPPYVPPVTVLFEQVKFEDLLPEQQEEANAIQAAMTAEKGRVE